MTEQNNAAAERSAHVNRGPRRAIPGESFLVEVSPGVFQIKAVVEAQREAAWWKTGLMRSVQYDNKCDQTGSPCKELSMCACYLEAEAWCHD